MGDPRSIPALLADRVASGGDGIAVVDGDIRLTWRQLADRADDVAAALVAVGVAPDDRVAIWAPNHHRWIETVLGLWRAGAVLVPINTRFKGAEAADMVRRSGVEVLFTTTDFLGIDNVALLRSADAALVDGLTVVALSGPVATEPGDPGLETDKPGQDTAGDVWTFEAFVARGSAEDRDVAAARAAALGPDDRSDILFTSGTTGLPKGVVMTHGRTLRVALDWAAMTSLGTDDRYLMINPYFHMFGLKAGILAAIAAGATMYPAAVFEVGDALETVARERITVLPGAPTIYQAILTHPDRDTHDLTSLRVAVTGAADIPVELIRRVREELPFSSIVTGYGLTEAGTASATGPDDDPHTVATTVGRPRPGFEIRIGDDGGEVAADSAGEIHLRGPSVMAHYLDDPDATAATLSDDGWLRTGDLGTIDEHGCLRIVGRVKDMFIVGGFNAYPAEIENALGRHPDVAQVAVIGVPDDRLGEVGMAFVVAAGPTHANAAAVIAWCRDEMANYKVPRVVEFVDALPTNATGKILKDELRARAAARP